MPKEAEAGSPAASNEDQPIAAAVDETGANSEAVTDANPAESSAADTTDANQEPKSLLDVVKNAVEPEAAPAAAESSTTEGEKDATLEGEAAAAEADKDAKGDDADLPFHKHPRWQEMKQQRDEFADDAGRYRNITAFMSQNGLSAEEVAEGFDVMAMLKSGDPAKLQQALEWFEPRINSLREQIGAVLPDDLQVRVDDGELSEDVARELASARATSKLREAADERQRERDAEDKARTDAETLGASMASAVQAWEDGIRKSDPDYAEKKAGLVETEVRALMLTEGRPKTVEEAVALTKRAYDKVDATLKAILPKPRPVDTTTPAGSSAKATAEPKTLLEAVTAAVAR